MSKHLKLTVHNVATECLAAAHDAHYVAGLLLIEKLDKGAIFEAALKLKRTARYLEQLAEKGPEV